MVSMRTIAAAAALMAMPSLAFADGSLQCVDVSVPKKAVEAGKGRWIELTSEQWQFLRGIYAMNPLTPPGLPFGDRAVLAKIDGHESGLVFFVDGNRACTPMAATKALLSLLDDVATSRISHEGSGL